MENQNKLIVMVVFALIIIAIFLIVLTPKITKTESQEKEETQIKYVVLEERYTPPIQTSNRVLLVDSYEIQQTYRTVYRDSCENSCPNYYNYYNYRNWEDIEKEDYNRYNRENYWDDKEEWRERDRERDYSSYARKTSRQDFLGSYVKEYKVYVSNREKTGEYFTVTFNFEDQRGFEYSESMTQYVKAGEKKLFLYKDIQEEKREIVDWDYEIKK